jgi:hypothetical protein
LEDEDDFENLPMEALFNPYRMPSPGPLPALSPLDSQGGENIRGSQYDVNMCSALRARDYKIVTCKYANEQNNQGRNQTTLDTLLTQEAWDTTKSTRSDDEVHLPSLNLSKRNAKSVFKKSNRKSTTKIPKSPD